MEKWSKEVFFTTFSAKTRKQVLCGIPTYSGISRTVRARTGPLRDHFWSICLSDEVSFGAGDPKIGHFLKGAKNSPLGAPRFGGYRAGVSTSDVGEPSAKTKTFQKCSGIAVLDTSGGFVGGPEKVRPRQSTPIVQKNADEKSTSNKNMPGPQKGSKVPSSSPLSRTESKSSKKCFLSTKR